MNTTYEHTNQPAHALKALLKDRAIHNHNHLHIMTTPGTKTVTLARPLYLADTDAEGVTAELNSMGIPTQLTRTSLIVTIRRPNAS